MRSVDKDILQEEARSICNYIMGELEHQIGGSYIVENAPTLEYEVYDRLTRKIRGKMAEYREHYGVDSDAVQEQE